MTWRERSESHEEEKLPNYQLIAMAAFVEKLYRNFADISFTRSRETRVIVTCIYSNFNGLSNS